MSPAPDTQEPEGWPQSPFVRHCTHPSPARQNVPLAQATGAADVPTQAFETQENVVITELPPAAVQLVAGAGQSVSTWH
jgi:hypothetical protein